MTMTSWWRHSTQFGQIIGGSADPWTPCRCPPAPHRLPLVLVCPCNSVILDFLDCCYSLLCFTKVCSNGWIPNKPFVTKSPWTRSSVSCLVTSLYVYIRLGLASLLYTSRTNTMLCSGKALVFFRATLCRANAQKAIGSSAALIGPPFQSFQFSLGNGDRRRCLRNEIM